MLRQYQHGAEIIQQGRHTHHPLLLLEIHVRVAVRHQPGRQGEVELVIELAKDQLDLTRDVCGLELAVVCQYELRPGRCLATYNSSPKRKQAFVLLPAAMMAFHVPSSESFIASSRKT